LAIPQYRRLIYYSFAENLSSNKDILINFKKISKYGLRLFAEYVENYLTKKIKLQKPAIYCNYSYKIFDD